MPKRTEVLNKIKKRAKANGVTWGLLREGGNHTVYSLDGTMIPIPRHSEIDNQLAEAIYKQCADKLGKDWWRK